VHVANDTAFSVHLRDPMTTISSSKYGYLAKWRQDHDKGEPAGFQLFDLTNIPQEKCKNINNNCAKFKHWYKELTDSKILI
jgi:hypothetical protein